HEESRGCDQKQLGGGKGTEDRLHGFTLYCKVKTEASSISTYFVPGFPEACEMNHRELSLTVQLVTSRQQLFASRSPGVHVPLTITAGYYSRDSANTAEGSV
ncbi:MAG: hypothetical protein WBQ52_16305, partial [Terracidiphilus sp.]